MFDFGALLTVEGAIALLTLTALEIVLGIDNVIFIAILSGKLPEEQQTRARNIGLLLAMVQRIVLLLLIGLVLRADKTMLFEIPWPWPEHGEVSAEHGAESHGAGWGTLAFSIKDLIILLGGLFLIGKATKEIHEKLEGDAEEKHRAKPVHTFGSVLMQIMLVDLVFSVDSVLTAVGLTKNVLIMIIAVVVSVLIMIAFAGWISRFVARHPTIKMLALALLILIGVLLVAESTNVEIPRGYVYFAMAFSLGVELLNIKAGARKGKTRGPALSE